MSLMMRGTRVDPRRHRQAGSTQSPPPRGGRLREREQTYLHPVGEPVAFGVGALHGEQDVAPRDDAPLWDRLDLDGQVSLVFL